MQMQMKPSGYFIHLHGLVNIRLCDIADAKYLSWWAPRAMLRVDLLIKKSLNFTVWFLFLTNTDDDSYVIDLCSPAGNRCNCHLLWNYEWWACSRGYGAHCLIHHLVTMVRVLIVASATFTLAVDDMLATAWPWHWKIILLLLLQILEVANDIIGAWRQPFF